MNNKNYIKKTNLSLSKLSTVFLYILNLHNIKKDIKSHIINTVIELKIKNETKNELILPLNIIKLNMYVMLREIKIEENPLIRGTTANNHGLCSTRSWN